MLQFEVEEEMMHSMAKRIQGMYRSHKCHLEIKKVIKAIFVKRWDQTLKQFYYVNTRTGECAWQKPINLGSDDIEDPPDRWEKMVDEYGNTFYLHPLTGRSSWLSEEQAAIKTQRLWRKRCAADFHIKDIGTIIKALRFQADAEKKYTMYPDRLSSIVNYALLLHCFDHDMIKARQLYKRAIEMAPHNPLVTRAYALFLLAVCEPPRQQSWLQAVDMLRTAKRRDPEFKKFHEAEDSFFKWAVVSQPTNSQALCNWAIIKQSIHQDYDEAEKFYRKAVEADPDDALVLQNYDQFLEQRLPGGIYAGGGPGEVVRKQSEIVKENPHSKEDHEWFLMRDPQARDPKFAKFWWNKLSGETRWEEPDWENEWTKRRQRSKEVQRYGDWAEMVDAAIDGTTFYYNQKFNKYAWINPYA
jgi:tetratricopeptide (TPR) repeat protein